MPLRRFDAGAGRESARLMADPIEPWRWALSVPVGVVASFGGGLVLNVVVGPGKRSPDRGTTVVSAVILLLYAVSLEPAR